MSCNYAEGLSPYDHKGVLGVPEKFEPIDKFNKKCELLAQFISQSKHIVVHTGAGISTSAGIPDFRGPNGVWTLEKEGKKPKTNISFTDAKPTKTHMILKKLVECNRVQFIVSQNIDGLHLKSGLQRKYLAELHGNMFIDECNVCKRQFVRSSPVETVGKKCSGVPCASDHVRGRPCRGRLYDGVLDWEHSLPENDLLMAEWHSSIADLSICLGTTLQIVPSGNLPLETAKYGGKLVICNLQPTKHDNKADLTINYYVDDILERVMNILGIDIPAYNEADNLTKLAETTIIDWTIPRKDVLLLEKTFKAKCKGVKKRRITKNKRNSADFNTNGKGVQSKMIKLEIKEETVTEDVTNNPTSVPEHYVTNGATSVTEQNITTSVTEKNVSTSVTENNVTNDATSVPEHYVTTNSTSVTEQNVTTGVTEKNVTSVTEKNVTSVTEKNGTSVTENNVTNDATSVPKHYVTNDATQNDVKDNVKHETHDITDLMETETINVNNAFTIEL